MPKYRVLMTRQRVLTEHAVVYVTSSSETYAQRDAIGKMNVDWQTDDVTEASCNAAHVQQIKG